MKLHSEDWFIGTLRGEFEGKNIWWKSYEINSKKGKNSIIKKIGSRNSETKINVVVLIFNG